MQRCHSRAARPSAAPVPPPPHRELFVPDKASEAGAQPQPREPRSPWPPGALFGAGVWRPPPRGVVGRVLPRHRAGTQAARLPGEDPLTPHALGGGSPTVHPGLPGNKAAPSRRRSPAWVGRGGGRDGGRCLEARGRPAPGSPRTEPQLCSWLQGRAVGLPVHILRHSGKEGVLPQDWPRF